MKREIEHEALQASLVKPRFRCMCDVSQKKRCDLNRFELQSREVTSKKSVKVVRTRQKESLEKRFAGKDADLVDALNKHLFRPLTFIASTKTMESTHQGIMDRQGDTADVDALVNYIKELEINLAKKDELPKVKDYQIESLHAEVSGKKGSNTAARVFRARVVDGAVTPRNNLELNQTLVSDDSGEVEASIDEESLSLSLSLSHDLSHISKISKVGSSSEENSPSDQEARDGRWNIPFDGTEFEELVAKVPPGKSARNALRDSGFVPIKEGRPVRLSTSEPVTPVRPIPRSAIVSSPFAAARRGVLMDVMKDKENVSPKRSSISPLIQSLRGIR